MLVEHDGVPGAAVARQLQRERPARDRDHPRAGVRCELRQQRAEKPDAHDGDGLAGFDPAALEDVAGAPQWLARHGGVAQPFRQMHDGIRRGEVVLGMRAIAERRDPIAFLQAGDTGTEGGDAAPAFVTWRAGRLRIVEPFAAFPQRQAGGADARALQPQQHLARSRFGKLQSS
jgi:hypothetical protein